MEQNDSIAQHVLNNLNFVREITDMGEPISDAIIMTKSLTHYHKHIDT